MKQDRHDIILDGLFESFVIAINGGLFGGLLGVLYGAVPFAIAGLIAAAVMASLYGSPLVVLAAVGAGGLAGTLGWDLEHWPEIVVAAGALAGGVMGGLLGRARLAQRGPVARLTTGAAAGLLGASAGALATRLVLGHIALLPATAIAVTLAALFYQRALARVDLALQGRLPLRMLAALSGAMTGTAIGLVILALTGAALADDEEAVARGIESFVGGALGGGLGGALLTLLTWLRRQRPWG